jgi:tRNA 2-selenouridine synthase
LSRPDSRDFTRLFLADAPMIDTRSPGEFAEGAFPLAVNLPLMDDDQRAQVGLCYKQQGQQAAIALGHQLVNGPVKDSRIAAWRAFAETHPDGYLYCFRGGLRSRISQQWLQEAGIAYPRIIGGYKAMRRFLIHQLEASAQHRFIIISGQTGCAKTRLLQNVANAVDLEGLANHRGSAFGKRLGGQPTQIGFENALSIALLKRRHAAPQTAIVLEDESRLIGRIAVPEVLRDSMTKAPLAVIEMPLADRVEHTFHNYILQNLSDWQAQAGDVAGFASFAEELRQNLATLQRRLGGHRHSQLLAEMNAALAAHARGNPEAHRAWIEWLLRDYYDPMYAYQLGLKSGRVVFRGSYAEVAAYLGGAS